MRILLIEAKLLTKLVTINPTNGLMYIYSLFKQDRHENIKTKTIHQIVEFLKKNMTSKVLVKKSYLNGFIKSRVINHSKLNKLKSKTIFLFYYFQIGIIKNLSNKNIKLLIVLILLGVS